MKRLMQLATMVFILIILLLLGSFISLMLMAL